MKFLVVLALLVSGLGWGYTRGKTGVHRELWRSQDASGSALERAAAEKREPKISAGLLYAAERKGRAAGALTDPVLLMLFGATMFLMSWSCVAWASWRERHVTSVWDSGEGEFLAEAG